jgi:TusA-related sulfurtransferase
VPAHHHLDLLGVPCPLSWAKAKVVLAELDLHDLLEITLDDPRGARDLPQAAEAEGHHVVESRCDAGRWTITIEK